MPVLVVGRTRRDAKVGTETEIVAYYVLCITITHYIIVVLRLDSGPRYNLRSAAAKLESTVTQSPTRCDIYQKPI